jgi:hypothetical protein
MITLDQVLDSAMLLNPEQQETLIEIIQKRQIEAWRKETALSARQAIQAFRAGNCKPVTAEGVISHLNTISTELEE